MKWDIHAKVEIKNKKGEVIQVIEKDLNSYVLGLIDYLRAHWNATTSSDTVAIVDRSGSSRNFRCGYYSNVSNAYIGWVLNAIAGDDNYGLLVGTSTDAIGIDDYNLNASIAHGSGAGQLGYGATSLGTPLTTGSTRRFVVSRTFTNDSGSDITVEEVGMATKAFYTTSTLGYFLIEHSLLHFVIADGTSATVTYTIGATA